MRSQSSPKSIVRETEAGTCTSTRPTNFP
jgi:hypothetical protein